MTGPAQAPPRVRPGYLVGYAAAAAAALVICCTPDMLGAGVAGLVLTVVFWGLHGRPRVRGAVGGFGIGTAGLSAIVAGAYWPALGAVSAGLMLALGLLCLGEREVRYAVQGLFVLSLAMMVVLIEQASLVVPVLGVWALAVVAMAALSDQAVTGAQATLRPLLRLQGTRLAAAAVPLVLLGLAAWLLIPVSDGPRRNFGGSPSGDADGQRQAAPYLGAGPMDLSMRGRLPETKVATVPGDAPPLWRVAALSRYDGRQWLPARNVAGRLGERGDRDTIWEVHPHTGFGIILAPGVPSDLLAAGMPRDPADPRPYRVRTGPYPSVSERRPGIPGAGSDSPDSSVWTQLPPSVTARTRGLARQVTGGTDDPQRAAQLISDHLTGGDYRYDLDAPVATPGHDSVDHFLFDSRAGFCEHYASAAVVMLRSQGFSARVATGFRNGSPDGDERLIRATDAHAWVEVYVEGRGWVTADPTPAGEAGGLNLLSLLLRYEQQIGWLALAAAPALGLGILLARRYGRRTPVRAGQARGDAADELVRSVQRLHRELATRIRPGSTMSDLAARAPEVQMALAVADRHVYSAREIPAQDLRAAVEALDAYTEELVAARRGDTTTKA